ncbi:hypothetical protein [Salegentibacter agarivorans]|uniref:hypothetical protein n=1 Tax=Salegentibacter agarivorans TaxID=345907 RepID=UPI0015A6D76A|nr:hypothetical protein [Salegentibacter agarivorans]
MISSFPEQLVQFKKNQWIVENGEYEFKIGASSTDIRLSATVRLRGNDLVLNKGRSIFFSLNNAE